MQGRKHFSPQIFYQTSLEQLVPEDNFYRIISKELNLHFKRKFTEAVKPIAKTVHYGRSVVDK